MFEKKWTDKQNEKILELHGRIPNSEIAKQFNTTATNISKRVSYLKKLKKKQKKKPTKKKVIKKAKPKQEKKIEVATAPTHPEADEFVKEYKQEFIPINESPKEEILDIDNLENESQIEEIQQEETKENKLNWNCFSESITTIIDGRFTANDLAPMSEEEKQGFSNALNEVLVNRAELFFKYADVISLGVVTFSVFAPRIIEFTSRKKKEKSEIEKSATQDLTKSEVSVSQTPKEEIKEDIIIDEQEEAQKRYIEAMNKLNG